MATAISARGLSKQYRIGQFRGSYDTLREHIVQVGQRLIGRVPKGESRTIWAIRDVDFDIEEGEIVGIIGRNGAGKTTLLRVLSRITEPTKGYVDVRGRLGSLLEVGTGFHPELTGRENIFLNGAILGMRRNDIIRRFDEIVEFAGVDKFLDTPVKRYSSGMFVRLAFSVAAHLEPEILLVDEVLAVGDAEFQRKCIGKMESVGRGGRTVIFVSHSMPAIARLCSRALLMHNGQLVADGPSDEVVARYLQGEVGSPSLRSWEPDAAPGDDLVRLREVAVVDGGGETVESTDVRDPVGIRFEFDVLAFGAPIVPQIMVTNEQGLHCFNAFDTNPRWHEPTPPGRHTVTAWLPGNLLNEGLMSVTVFLSTLTSGRTIQHVLERDIVSFHVTDPVEGDSSKGTWAGQWGGAVRPLLLWTPESSLRQDERVGLRLLDGREVV